MKGALRQLWPRSLKAQILCAIALALLLAQGINATLLYRSLAQRRDAALIHSAVFRLFGPELRGSRRGQDGASGNIGTGRRSSRAEWSAISPRRPDEPRLAEAESELLRILSGEDIAVAQAVVFRRAIADDPIAQARLARRLPRMTGRGPPPPERVLIAAIQRTAGGRWEAARVFEPRTDGPFLSRLLGQTLLIYLVLVGAMAVLLRRITRPLAALTSRLERFAQTRDPRGRLEPQGPEDICRLIEAHNAMEAAIAALLDEKDVMLGAIGHDLKTPLTALRVRIESVEDEAERARMAGTIEDIVRTLDDILSLARVGRPSDPCEPTELSALVASVVEEYEDMGEPVTMDDTGRIVLPLRATWLRRAMRNLVGNALRYGTRARVAVGREGHFASIRIDDDGPGIPPHEIAGMLEPFARGDPSRNSDTGGAGLGLTLARAIAEQHGGTLRLANRIDADGRTAGLRAELRLPLA